MIRVAHLTKEFRVHRRDAGLAAAVRSLFRRRYDTVTAVRDLCVEIVPGERVGFLGPNGAGKTTTLKVLAGLLHPTGGEVRVLGHVPQRREPDFLRQITLVMGQKQQLLWDLPPADTFELNRAVYSVPEADFRVRRDEIVELLGIGDTMRKPTRQLSLGERMKCELCAALLHGPRVLFLDEPTIGLDVSMQHTVREFIRVTNERHGSTVLLTSHYMVDVLALCPRVIVIDRGRLCFDGRLEELVRSARPEKRIVVKLERPVERADLEAIGHVVRHDAAVAVLQVGNASLREAMARLLAGLPVADLTVEDPPLEEVMRDLFAREAGAAGADADGTGGPGGGSAEGPEEGEGDE
ncbi:MAG: ATP-binding cassette domain-containing protein [Deltaproteobacteria bacterium]|nr:ATP-binding cassette domain-containing protein [Deltaproteobacteria bacterium]